MLGTRPGVGNIVVNRVAKVLDREQVNTNSSVIWGSNKCYEGDFLGGAVVENPPANTEDTGSSPGPGRFHMLQSN